VLLGVVKEIDNMKIIFEPIVYKKLRAYVHGINYEISGFAKTIKQGNIIRLTDIKIFPQVVTSAHTEMDAESLGAFWDGLQVAGEDIGLWKCWWHSHVEMAAHFSTTDYATIDEFDAEVPEENWMLSIVTNKQGDLFAQIDIYEPIRCTIAQIPWEVEMRDEQLAVDVAEEIFQNVTIKGVKKDVIKKINSFTWLKKPFSLTEQQKKEMADKLSIPLKNHLFPPLREEEFPNIEEGIILPKNQCN
jgi:hypothetical protein